MATNVNIDNDNAGPPTASTMAAVEEGPTPAAVDTQYATENQQTALARRVEHDYHDHAHVTEMDMVIEGVGKDATPEPSSLEDAENQHSMADGGENTNATSNTSMNLDQHQKQNLNFPVRLHYMLSELERDGLSHIVSWQPHGRCFLVHNQQRFVDEVLPLWFRQTRYPSFQRQLNLYGFKRLTAGRDKGGYYHEKFLRSKRFLAHHIDRIKIKGTGARKPSSPETEPNFYLTPFLPPTPPEPENNLNSKSAIANTSTAVRSVVTIGGCEDAHNGASSQPLPTLVNSTVVPQDQPGNEAPIATENPATTLAALAAAQQQAAAASLMAGMGGLGAGSTVAAAAPAPTMSREESIQRLLMSSVMPMSPAQGLPGGNGGGGGVLGSSSNFLNGGSGIPASLASTALLLEARRTQLASELLMQQAVQQQQLESASLERLAMMLSNPLPSSSPSLRAAAFGIGMNNSNNPGACDNSLATMIALMRHRSQQGQQHPLGPGKNPFGI